MLTNDELKKKIISALQSIEFVTEKGWCGQCISLRLDYSAIADTLIAAGIGDVKESENKATATELVAQAAASTAIKKIAEWKHRAEVYKRALDIAHTAGEFAYYVDKAEKELAEENNDNKNQ